MIKRTNVKEISRDQYTSVYNAGKYSIFSSAAWLELVAGNHAIINYFSVFFDGHDIASIALPFRHGRIFKLIPGLPYTPHYQILLYTNVPSTQRAAHEAIAELVLSFSLSSSYIAFDPCFNDYLPFKRAGFTVNLRQTYRLDLSKSESELSKNLRKNKLSAIKKAQRSGYKVSFERDEKSMKDLIVKTYERRSMNPRQLNVALDILKYYPDGFQVTAFHNEVALSSVFIAHDHKTAYYLFSGFDWQKEHPDVGAFTLWNGIIEAKRRGLLVFDFEGSEIPTIENYFTSFGSQRVCYFSIRKSTTIARILKKLT